MHFREAFDPFRALQSAFALLRKAPLALLVGGFLLWICDEILPAIGFSGDGNHNVDLEGLNPEQFGEVMTEVGREAVMAITAAAIVFGLALMLAAFLLAALLRIGMARATERVMTEGEAELEDLFQSRGRWTTMVAVRFLQTLLTGLVFLPAGALVAIAVFGTLAATDDGARAAGVGIVTFLVALPVVLWVTLGWSLAPCAVAVEGMGVIESFSRSWSLVRGHRWTLFLYFLVTVLLQLLLGWMLCCCCCGLPGFLPTAWIETATFESYLRLVRPGDPSTWLDKPADSTSATPA